MNLKAFLSTALLSLSMLMPAQAYDYTIEGAIQAEFYPSTSYDQMYGATYQYGSIHVSDVRAPTLPYGIHSHTSIGVMDVPMVTLGQSTGRLVSPWQTGPTTPVIPTITPSRPPTEPTISASGKLGTLTIPALDLVAPIYTDTSTSSLAKGVGHFSHTATWQGNVGIAGHNRGSRYTLGDIHELELGDVIKYTTNLGTKVYSVTSVSRIANEDWSRLTATTDNRITLISCVKNEPNLRWCVQAQEF